MRQVYTLLLLKKTKTKKFQQSLDAHWLTFTALIAANSTNFSYAIGGSRPTSANGPTIQILRRDSSSNGFTINLSHI